MKIAVVGAHGVVGRATIPLLLERGFFVRGIGPRAGASVTTECDRFEFVTGDILNCEQMYEAISGFDVVIHLATAVPKPGPVMDWSKNDIIRRQGTASLLQACARARVPRYIQQSVTMLYRAGGSTWLDEDSELAPNAVLESAFDMEFLVREAGSAWIILRGGLLYGPSTGREAGWFAQARSGKLRVPGDGSDFASFLHQDDFGAAICNACDARTMERKIFNIVDDEPATWRTVFDFVASRARAAMPPIGGPVIFPSQRVRNARAKAALKWAPKYRSYREGLTQSLEITKIAAGRVQ